MAIYCNDPKVIECATSLKTKSKKILIWLFEQHRGNELYETMIGNELAERGVLYY